MVGLMEGGRLQQRLNSNRCRRHWLEMHEIGNEPICLICSYGLPSGATVGKSKHLTVRWMLMQGLAMGGRAVCSLPKAWGLGLAQRGVVAGGALGVVS